MGFQRKSPARSPTVPCPRRFLKMKIVPRDFTNRMKRNNAGVHRNGTGYRVRRKTSVRRSGSGPSKTRVRVGRARGSRNAGPDKAFSIRSISCRPRSTAQLILIQSRGPRLRHLLEIEYAARLNARVGKGRRERRSEQQLHAFTASRIPSFLTNNTASSKPNVVSN